MSIDRRQLLLGGLLWPLGGKGRDLRLSGDASAVGHRLWQTEWPKTASREKTGVLILGAGVAGCSAAYTLQKAGYADFRLLDVGTDAGGNARSGRNAVSAYPLGAHYLPLPDYRQEDLLAFLQDAGALQGWSARGEAIYNEEYTCHDPEERVFYEGRWCEGLIPWKVLPAAEIKDLRAFFALADKAREGLGRDGKRLFDIPLDASSRDSEWLRLDRLSFADFIRGQGWHGSYLAWYLDYCCRDDYGTSWDQTSAWAGLHYFAARAGSGEEGGNVLTWPEGNHFLVRKLLQRSRDKFRGEQLIHRVQKQGGLWQVTSWDAAAQVGRLWEAEALIVALPAFITQRFLPEFPGAGASYAPWMVANCWVNRLPESEGALLAWDNVPFGSRSLGYVVATHQNLQRYAGASVLTSYWPLTGADARLQRMYAGMRSLADWERMVVGDLERMHPGYGEAIASIDVWLWGHGMVQPKPGYLWGTERARMNETRGQKIAFAHSDRSGISIFEEAFARGRAAARSIIPELRGHA